MYVCSYVYMICMYVRMYMWVDVHVHTHTHTHTWEQKALTKAAALCDEELARMGTPLAEDHTELNELKKQGGLDESNADLLRRKIALEYRIGVKSILSAFRAQALQSIGQS